MKKSTLTLLIIALILPLLVFALFHRIVWRQKAGGVDNYPPVGKVGNFNHYYLSGYALDPDTPDNNTQVDIYYYPANGSGWWAVFVGQKWNGILSEPKTGKFTVKLARACKICGEAPDQCPGGYSQEKHWQLSDNCIPITKGKISAFLHNRDSQGRNLGTFSDKRCSDSARFTKDENGHFHGCWLIKDLRIDRPVGDSFGAIVESKNE